MNSAPLVDGALELGFFEALIRGDWQAAAHAVAQAPVGAVTHHALPGTVVEPSSADIDAFGFALPLASFALHFPDLFSISVGGASVPSSSIDLCSTREFRFIGTANSSVYIHIPAEEYPGLFAFLPPAAPSIHQMRASSTKRCTMPLPAFKEALAEAHISEVLVTCYGLKANELRLLDLCGWMAPLAALVLSATPATPAAVELAVLASGRCLQSTRIKCGQADWYRTDDASSYNCVWLGLRFLLLAGVVVKADVRTTLVDAALRCGVQTG